MGLARLRFYARAWICVRLSIDAAARNPVAAY